jgi:hypothetical protein
MSSGRDDSVGARRFEFDRDTFAFANELVWEYRLDLVTGRMRTLRNDPPPTYAHRCFVMVRSARQFFYHARFEPEAPPADAATYRRLIRAVVARDPCRPGLEAERVIIPGYMGLRAFSGAHAALLKAGCGGAWQSYCLWSHWRMVFPFSRRHQARMARQLAAGVARAPIVHLVRFPSLTINHGIVLFEVQETGLGARFAAYDPNVPAQPAELTYDAAQRTFFFPRNHYWAGGRVDVLEVYRGAFG